MHEVVWGNVGGGDISSTVNNGWIHRTIDAGRTWSPRVPTQFQVPNPVGQFMWETYGCRWGRFFSGVGGVYTSVDQGATWQLSIDIDAGVEMAACATSAQTKVIVCVGSAKNKRSVVISATC